MEYINKFLIGTLKNVTGSASRPVAYDNRVIAMFVSTDGIFETIPENKDIEKVYPKARESYRGWWRSQAQFRLGDIFTGTIVGSDTELAHLLVLDKNEMKADILKTAIDKLGKYCATDKRNLHINKTENWDVVLPLLEEFCVKRGVNVFVYGKEA